MVIALSPLCCLSASLFPDKYDDDFKDAAIHLPVGTDWRLLKAQCYQESRLNPFARSPVGAMGVCQFMPGTWSDIQKRDAKRFDNPWSAEQSILAAAIYMKQLNRFWSSPRPTEDRYKLALASYNAGAGHLVKAQKIAHGSVYYEPIIEQLHMVTGHHSEETTNYVELIYHRWYPMLRIE